MIGISTGTGRTGIWHTARKNNMDYHEACDIRDYKLIQYQIIQTNIRRTVWQTVRRITNEILGVKGLKDITHKSCHKEVMRIVREEKQPRFILLQ